MSETKSIKEIVQEFKDRDAEAIEEYHSMTGGGMENSIHFTAWRTRQLTALIVCIADHLIALEEQKP